ncbi:MAG: hypothetical protein Q9174_004188 [Haloplaca sp. 1 TL-2023]
MHRILRFFTPKPLPSTSLFQRSTHIRPFHTNYNPLKEEQTLTLPTGHTIGFAEYGSPSGTPMFALHGSPGSRYDALWLTSVAKKYHIRIIAPDRPGHGTSTFQKDRRLIDYPSDISQLAKHLGIERYHVIGHSGGGPYALACAYGLPPKELLNVGVVAGMGPPPVLTLKDAGLYTVYVMNMMTYLPRLMRFFINMSVKDGAVLNKNYQHMMKYLTEEDRAEIGDPESQRLGVKSLMEAYKQGADGAIRDGQIYSSPWGFELKDVHKKVHLFYGAKDTRTPLAFGRYLKAHLPNAELVEYEGASHFTIPRYHDEIFAKLTGHN